MVAQACNPSYGRQRSGELQFEASPGKTLARTPYSLPILNNKPDIVVHICDPSYNGCHKEKNLGPRPTQGKKRKTLPKK
jgi:hypothetical protein